MDFLFLFFFACLVPRYPDVEVNPGPRTVRRRACRILCSNIRGLYANLNDLSVAASSYDLVLCSETLVSGHRHSSELAVPYFSRPVLRLHDPAVRGSRGLAAYVREGRCVSRQKIYECQCCEFIVMRVCGSVRNFYIFSVYRSPSIDNKIFDCLMEAMASIQSSDAKSCFLFVGDFNSHHVEFGSPRTDRSGQVAVDFAAESGCEQLVREPTHSHGGTLDLLFTDVPELVSVSVVAPIGGSDHSTLSISLDTAQRVPEFTVRREVYLKSRANWDAIAGAMSSLPWSAIRSSADPGMELDRHVSDVVRSHVPSRIITVRSQDKPWFDDSCRRAYQLKQEAYRNWRRGMLHRDYLVFVELRRRAKEVYAVAEQEYRARARETLQMTTNSHKWWSTLKSSVFGARSSIPPLIGDGGSLVTDSVEKADLFLRHFDEKQSRDKVTVPLSCFPRAKLSSFAFRSGELRSIMMGLDSYGGTDPSGVFPLVLKKSANVLARPLASVFRVMLKRGSFPVCWRLAHVTPVPKTPNSSFVRDYRPISITPVLSKVYEKLMASRLGRFFETAGVMPDNQYGFRKGLGTTDALLHVSHVLQSALDHGCEAKLVQIDFSAAFDRVNHEGLLFKLRSVGVGGSFFSVIQQFLTDRRQCVSVDGGKSGFVDVVSGVPQGSVLGPLLFILYTADLFSVVNNLLVGYADDATLVSVAQRPADREAVSRSLQSDLDSINSWCSTWGMHLNVGKTKTMTVSRSRTLLPRFPDIMLDGVALKKPAELEILGVSFDSKLTFERHIRSVASSASQRIGLMRRAFKIFDSADVVQHCFRSFMLPILEYASVVWSSAAASHLALLDRIVNRCARLMNDTVPCCLDDRRSVAGLCMLYKIRARVSHPLFKCLPVPLRRDRLTRRTEALHDYAFEPVRHRTNQYGRSFIPSFVSKWNSLDSSVFAGEGLGSFKSLVNRSLFG